MDKITGISLSGWGEPLTKFLDVIRLGIGKIYEPTHIRRMAKAKADEINILSEVITNNTYTPSKQVAVEALIDSSAKQLQERANTRSVYKELKRQQNIESIIITAYEKLKLEDKVSDNPVDADWISRFFNIAEEIGDEQMRKLWGKILADEIKRPESFSLRTLDILKNISQNEAQTFEKISRIAFVHPEYIGLPFNNKFYEIYNISYEDILLLSDAGLINLANSSIGFKTGDELNEDNIKDNSLIAGNYAIVYNIKNKFVYKKEDNTGNLPGLPPCLIETFRFYFFTQSGRELHTIIEPTQNIEYLKTFCNLCINKFFFEKIRIHKIKKLTEYSLDCDESVNLLDSI